MEHQPDNPFQRFSHVQHEVAAVHGHKVEAEGSPAAIHNSTTPKRSAGLLAARASPRNASTTAKLYQDSSPSNASSGTVAGLSEPSPAIVSADAAQLHGSVTHAITPATVTSRNGSGGRKSKAAAADKSPPAGMPERLGDSVCPLRMIIVGHNPSEETWRRGHAYAHPSNHMWRILIKTGIAPPGINGADDDVKLPVLAGVGFSDVGTGHPGTESASFHSSVFVGWSQNFYARMRAHMAKASSSIGCSCGTCGAPPLIAFSGKRQFLELLNIGKKGAAKVKSVEFGLQPPDLRPPDWPFPPSTELWVCSSTSGASPMTHAQREAPYQAVAARLAMIAWPYTPEVKCRQ